MSTTVTRLRRAVSLVELLVVMSGLTVVLTTTATLMHRVMRAQVESRSCSDVERAALRISEQFRDDVHQATTAQTAVDADLLVQLELPGDQVVQYRRAGQSVLRTLSRGGAVRSRSQFTFTSTSAVEIHEQDAPERLVLTVTSAAQDEPRGGKRQIAEYLDPPANVRVEAVLGRDWRSAVPTADEEALP